MKHLFSIYLTLAHSSIALSQFDSTKLYLRDPSVMSISLIGDCYFEHKEFRINGNLKKVVRHNGNGLTMILRYDRNGKEIRTRIKKGPVMNQTPPCY